jgi:large subunit ribosomal protein L5
MDTLKEHYKNSIKGELQKKFNFSNPMKVPALKKVIITMGIAEASKDKNSVQDHISELTALTGQKPIVTRSKKAISNFKLRKGQPIGLKVTLRGQRMFDFVERFCHIASPRIRDFRGFPTKADGSGNYSLGLEDQQIFAEINLDKVKRAQGMNINFVTSAANDEECIELLRQLGVAFKGLDVIVPNYPISSGGKSAAPRKVEAKKAEAKTEAKSVDAEKTEVKAEGKKAAAKKTDSKKTESKKVEGKKSEEKKNGHK